MRTDTTTARMAPPAAPRRRRPPRWGWRTLGFLVLAGLAVVTSELQGHHSPGTLGSLVLGVAGGAYCSLRGVQALLRLEWLARARAGGSSRSS